MPRGVYGCDTGVACSPLTITAVITRQFLDIGTGLARRAAHRLALGTFQKR